MAAAGRGRLSRGAGLSDDEIVERIRGGDVSLYEVLLRRYNERVYRAVRAILGEEPEIEDVMQDAYLSAYRGLDGFESRALFSTWLVRIAVNHALDWRRRRGRMVAVDPSDDGALLQRIAPRLGSAGRDPEQQVARDELVRLLEGAIEALPAPHRAVYVLREVQALDTHDTAACLGIDESTVRTRLHRARRLLREGLGRDAGDVARDVFRFAGARCDRVVAGVLARLAALAGRGGSEGLVGEPRGA